MNGDTERVGMPAEDWSMSMEEEGEDREERDEKESLKQVLERLLRKRSPRLTLRCNEKGKNRFIWSQFEIAYLDGVEQQYAACKYCKSFVKYTGRTGTGGLMRHFCYKQMFRSKEEQERKKAMGKCADDIKSRVEEVFAQESYMPADKPSLRTQLEVLIYQKSPRIGYIPNYKGKSGVWSQFYIITLDHVAMDFACCVACRSVVTYMSRTGTGSMTRHKCQNNSSFRDYLKRRHGDPGPPVTKKKRPPYFVSEEEDPLVEIKTEEADWDEEVKSEPSEWNENKEPESTPTGELTSGSTEDRVDRVAQHARFMALPFLGNQVLTPLSKFLLDSWRPSPERGSTSSPSPEPGASCLSKEAEDVKRKHIDFLKNSLSLLNITENESFLQFAQTLVDLGAKYGKVDVRQIFKDQINLSDLLKD